MICPKSTWVRTSCHSAFVASSHGWINMGSFNTTDVGATPPYGAAGTPDPSGELLRRAVCRDRWLVGQPEAPGVVGRWPKSNPWSGTDALRPVRLVPRAEGECAGA